LSRIIAFSFLILAVYKYTEFFSDIETCGRNFMLRSGRFFGADVPRAEIIR